ncbi:MAG: oligopeptide transporter, OPT family [Terricaulis silvestris]
MKQSELTIRGLILGAIIAVVFTAANVYLGLFVAITVASSIPAAVISMGVLRLFKTGTIRENNIVQTVASSGGTLSAIIFVLPGLVMIGYWRGFDYLTTFLICALGGILGVLFSIPLRRALVVNTPLPFPEGVAAAEVLKVGATGDEASPDAIERNRGPLVVAFGAATAALLKVLSFVGISAESLTKVFRIGVAGATGVDLGITLALAGAGHIVGISVGMAMLLGLLITWAGFVPLWTQGFTGDMGEAVTATWRHVRLVGAGAIGTAAIWSLVKLVGPLIGGVNATLKARANAAPATGAADDRDLPMSAIVLISLGCLAMIAWLIWNFIGAGALSPLALTLTIGGVIFVVVVGFFIAAVAGYMAGLIGASNSPVSGIGILATLAAAALLAVYAQPILGPQATDALIAFTLFLVAVVFSVATISNDNLQDLKTGFLVGASPWKQQVALIVGVLAGSAIIPPVLDLMNHAYGFPGDPNRHAIGNPVSAPQAVLISTLAKGVLSAQLDWGLIGIGVGLGAALILLDEVLGLMKLLRLPPLAVGLGIYLPMSATQPVVLGAIIGWFYNRAMDKRPNAEMAKRFGVLLASGLIVGESLFGILQAGLIVATNKPQPLALVPPSFADVAPWVGIVLFALFLFVSYAWTSRQSKA